MTNQKPATHSIDIKVGNTASIILTQGSTMKRFFLEDVVQVSIQGVQRQESADRYLTFMFSTYPMSDISKKQLDRLRSYLATEDTMPGTPSTVRPISSQKTLDYARVLLPAEYTISMRG